MPKFHIGRPLRCPLPVNAGWNEIKTLDQGRLAWSVCVGICVALIVAVIWRIYSTESLPLGSPSWSQILFSLIILSLGHEAIHLLGFPNLGMSAETVVGVWPEAGSPYVQHLSPMSRNRFLIVSILPFLVLSILPLALAFNGAGPINLLSWLSVLNCVGAGSDLLIFHKVIRAVPTKAHVIEAEAALYWQKQGRACTVST